MLKLSGWGENILSMVGVLKTLRAVQWSMLVSILLYPIIGEVAGPQTRAVDPSLSYVFSTLAVGVVGAIFVVRRTLVLSPSPEAQSGLAQEAE